MPLREFFGLPPHQKLEGIQNDLEELDEWAKKDEELRRRIKARLAALEIDLQVMKRETGERT